MDFPRWPARTRAVCEVSVVIMVIMVTMFIRVIRVVSIFTHRWIFSAGRLEAELCARFQWRDEQFAPYSPTLLTHIQLPPLHS